MVFLDTHALIWWTLDPEKLSKKASLRSSKIHQTGAFISSISIWEIGIKIKNGGIDIGMSVEEYLFRIKDLNCIDIVPVDEQIWIESIALKWDHKDPADRVIVATAMMKSLPLISKDEKISAFYRNTIW